MKKLIALALPLIAFAAPVQAQYWHRPWYPRDYRPPARVSPWNRPAPAYEVPDMSGTWFTNGDPNKPDEVLMRPDGSVVFVNEYGDQALGTIQGDRIWVPTWETYNHQLGLEGRFRGDRIEWFNGSFWTR